ncbi:polysaccharide pyruvyl transferase family protein [Vibrio alginolyticus]|uniref:polysaccharide pyruvyl transferase family protein n=1 Tax=Vibrio alginolyticus TaxID=663 RepID=UPI0028F4081F|nr:polysaccharide pyruvyl transferase family protein [Vibrio alginolyticus]WMN48318.1 polysaccharide pyruvyl transferase family protein [Vibrio alginolyticus]
MSESITLTQLKYLIKNYVILIMTKNKIKMKETKTKPYYVILTGSKNNAGDYLIKYRAKQLFSDLRPDRDIIDIDGWKSFDEDTLELVNGAQALILMGGPALQRDMYPKVYPLTDDLSEIKAPIVLMGVGWKSLSGNWEDTQNYELSLQTKTLLTRISSDGMTNSVRDYHTLNVMQRNGVERTLMTGCPATYVKNMFDKSIVNKVKIEKVAFSLGVSFLESPEMERQMKATILRLRDRFPIPSQFEVVFHHSTKTEFLNTHNAKRNHLNGHLEFISWLEDKKIDYVDISGSADNLIEYYSSVDMHVGYRVHAHIFMNSISKPSILISEDGRGKALDKVFGGCNIDGFSRVKSSLYSKIKRKLKLSSGYLVDENIDVEVLNMIEYELNNDMPRLRKTRNVINDNYKVMNDFIVSLP